MSLALAISLRWEAAWAGHDFEYVYDTLAKSPHHDDLLRVIEEEVCKYFSCLDLPDEPTVYDRLLLSLCTKDLVATFNWDPLLVHPDPDTRSRQMAAPPARRPAPRRRRGLDRNALGHATRI
jgi:hypothetical protein